MKVYVDLTDNELRALRTCLAYSNRCCASGCTYPEMQQRKIECHNCDFTKNVDKIIGKFNNLKSLADYTKQVRKEVCEEIAQKMANKLVRMQPDGEFGTRLAIDWYDVNKVLDQIQGVEDGTINNEK